MRDGVICAMAREWTPTTSSAKERTPWPPTSALHQRRPLMLCERTQSSPASAPSLLGEEGRPCRLEFGIVLVSVRDGLLHRKSARAAHLHPESWLARESGILWALMPCGLARIALSSRFAHPSHRASGGRVRVPRCAEAGGAVLCSGKRGHIPRRRRPTRLAW